MTIHNILQLGPDALRQIGAMGPRDGCGDCRSLHCAGWEATPSSLDETSLSLLGTLRHLDQDSSQATLDEYHPARTSYWSDDAPIAPNYFPYNRCDVWACHSCGRAFLRYTEYGGYYVEQRIRHLNPKLIVDPDE